MTKQPNIEIVRDVQRYQTGWRSGKPVGDPAKLKRWGFIGAERVPGVHPARADRFASLRPGRADLQVAQIADALSGSIGTVNYTQIGSDPTGGPLNAVPGALAQLLALAKSFGLEIGK